MKPQFIQDIEEGILRDQYNAYVIGKGNIDIVYLPEEDQIYITQFDNPNWRPF